MLDIHNGPDSLSSQARTLWAKSDREGGEGWLPLHQHMADSAEIARYLWREWLAQPVRDQVIAHADSEKDAEALVVWLAASHDLGKATPRFQSLNIPLAEKVRACGLTLPDTRQSGPPYHAIMSQEILSTRLQEFWGWSSSVAQTYAIVPGGHHGVPPENAQICQLRNWPIRREGLGDEEWAKVQSELVRFATSTANIEPWLISARNKPLPPTLQMLLTGFVIMADWIASNTSYFPLFPTEGPVQADERAALAWHALDLPSPWHPIHDLPNESTLFHERFSDVSDDAQLRPAQEVVLEATESLSSPGLIILEAPMGSGKTEAALLAAELIAAKYQQGGVGFLLPTMATSNAMFSRVHTWLSNVPDSQGSHQTQSLNLIHGKAALNREFAKLPHWSASSMGDDPTSQNESAIAHSWFSGRKRSLLSSFVVGTVDQLLMAALKAKHVVLRHLGLAGKVVIIDEIHAYDAYMSVYLDRVLAWLGAYRVPVILLSATLPPSRRQAMIEAYLGGHRKPPQLPSAPRTKDNRPAYPLITTCDSNGVAYRTCIDDTRHLAISIEEFPDDGEALIEHLRMVMRDGGCVGIIRNTVSRAQETYELIRQNLDCDAILAHSRFIACDRAEKDTQLLRLLGKDAKTRPRNLIVVGTQVLEQSLDIDFDLLISDIAPIDLLLQRMGRLHRHSKWDDVRPSEMRQPRCLLTGVSDWSAEPPSIEYGTAKIYEKALIWRTMAALRTLRVRHEGKLRLPDEIASLVEAVYEDQRQKPESWREVLDAAVLSMELGIANKKSAAETFLLPRVPRDGKSVTGLLHADLKNADDDNQRGQATVRDSMDSIEVVVVQKRRDGTICLLPWITETNIRSNMIEEMSDSRSTLLSMDTELPLRELSTELEPAPETARLAATCTVALPPAMNWSIDSVIAELERRGGFPGWQQSPWLRGQLPLILDEEMNASIPIGSGRQFKLHYDQNLGLQLLRKEDARE